MRVEGRYHSRTTPALCEENSAAFPSSVFAVGGVGSEGDILAEESPLRARLGLRSVRVAGSGEGLLGICVARPMPGAVRAAQRRPRELAISAWRQTSGPQRGAHPGAFVKIPSGNGFIGWFY